MYVFKPIAREEI